MRFLDYIYNKVYAPVENDFGFDDAGDVDGLDEELDDELQPIGESSSSDGALYEHWKVQVDANHTRAVIVFSRLLMLVLSMSTGNL